MRATLTRVRCQARWPSCERRGHLPTPPPISFDAARPPLASTPIGAPLRQDDFAAAAWTARRQYFASHSRAGRDEYGALLATHAHRYFTSAQVEVPDRPALMAFFDSAYDISHLLSGKKELSLSPARNAKMTLVLSPPMMLFTEHATMSMLALNRVEATSLAHNALPIFICHLHDED